MNLSVGCTLEYQVIEPTVFIFNIEAAMTPEQIVRNETLSGLPGDPAERFVTTEPGNRCLRIQAPAGNLRIDYDADVETADFTDGIENVAEIPAGLVPPEVLTYLSPSRYCQSDRLARFADQQFGGLAPGHNRVTGICNWIWDNVEYLRGNTDSQTSACDTIVERVGVCRDFAHLGIALSRALGIPARFVSCYTPGLVPADFHAVFEAYLGGANGPRWYLFDPTRMANLDQLVRIGIGRDAADVSFATFFGQTTLTGMTVRAAAGSDASMDKYPAPGTG
ncbi:MAG: transglutaminase-like enzyme predicted cysteine protease [Rhodospirillales bacterium]|nr:transglutaminase-like enzyme predicted cysteine protease [Rhodospirillales bacterium]